MTTGIETFLQGSGTIRIGGCVLTDAQIKALDSTYITVVPPVGPKKMCVPLAALCYLDNVSGIYTNLDANLFLNIGGGAIPLTFYLEAENGAFGTASASPHVIFFPPAILADFATSKLSAWWLGNTADVTDIGIQLQAFNGALGPFTGGNAANKLTVIVFYFVLDLPS